ncbi:MAG: cell division protein FtsA [Pseudomonadales bacterium]|nr:cell division protein FtsA [Candidatus Woesebacteria bacterium]MCB9802124.1 cell division protein FtsA [Pseudomonadales bacterium]
MSKHHYLTAIDIGTDKCTTLIATREPEVGLKVTGVSAISSKGMRKSQIVDLEQVLSTVSESVDGAERMAGQEIESAYVSVSGAHISSLNSKGVVAVAAPNQEITPEDVHRVIEAARAISLSSEREIIHVIPKDFKVDSQEGIKDPVGMTGVRLESEAHIITGMSTTLRNSEKVLRDLGITVDGFVFSGLAAAQVVLSETEKELGVAIIDIGAGTTSLCVYIDGSLTYSDSIPVGARHITQDIALGCRVSIDAAEEIKLQISNESETVLKPIAGESKQDFQKRRKASDMLDITGITGDPHAEPLSKSSIVDAIMTPRIKEIFSLVHEKLEQKNVLADIPAGIVITGGGARTAHLVSIAKRELKLPARIGTPKEISGILSDINNPSYVTSIGLLEYGAQTLPAASSSEFSLPSFSGTPSFETIKKKLLQLLKSILP